MVYVYYLLLEEANIHISLTCFDRNFDHPHINVVTFVPSKPCKKKPQLLHKNTVVEKAFDMYLLLSLPHLLVKIAVSFVNYEKLTTDILFECFGVRFLLPFAKNKTKLSKWLTSREYRTNIDIILLFLGKPVDKRGITQVRITYPPLLFFQISHFCVFLL